jgi:hypothetical protein
MIGGKSLVLQGLLGLLATQHFALGAIFVYQLALLYRFEYDLELCVSLIAFLKSADNI